MESSGGSVSDSKEKRLKYEALVHLASIELIELCNEAKVECCRATRDLRSCGRNIQHVLTSCGHASLCAECSQRCDYCPICRIPISKTGAKLRARLYYECIDAGLIPKKFDDRFQDKENKTSMKQFTADVQRLYSLFDVALENNLISLVCHYVTDVCMDENAVSSDPIHAFLLDEGVVKDWCARTLGNIVQELHDIYVLGSEEMSMKIGSLMKLLVQLNGISNVLEVLESSFKDSESAWLDDMYLLLEKVSKAKQHLEIMNWCIRHRFLENAPSCHHDFGSWCTLVRERKTAAVSRSWPYSVANSGQLSGNAEGTLFIEDALLHLQIEQEEIGEPLEILCLQKDVATSFRSKIGAMGSCYPFENFRDACDILFLRGSPDLVVAKRAIFLYYMCDRFWAGRGAKWKDLIDDFAITFSITRHSLLECQTFYLLDDHREHALEEACRILPEIADLETHPKIAQVLLERQKPDAALMVLRCSGRDGLYSGSGSEKSGSQPVSLGEAVTAIRVRVECGLLTEAFMYQRSHCLKVKEEKWRHQLLPTHSSSLKHGADAWLDHVEALVTEICSLCVRRKLVDRMIEFPWNSDEENFLHKYLLDNASKDPSTTSGSLLVVFYLQRYRYIEAYEVDSKLQSIEEEFMLKSMDKEVNSRIRTRRHHRAGLIDKCIKLLPEIQQEQLKLGTSHSFMSKVDLPPEADTGMPGAEPLSLQVTSTLECNPFLKTRLSAPAAMKTSPSGSNIRFSGRVSKAGAELNNSQPPLVHGRLLIAPGSPSSLHKQETAANKGTFMAYQSNGGEPRYHASLRQEFPVDELPSMAPASPLVSQVIPFKVLNRTSGRTPQYSMQDGGYAPDEKLLSRMESNGSMDQADNVLKHSACELDLRVSGKRLPSDRPWTVGYTDERADSTWSFGNQVSPVAELPIDGGLRWRSDETSDDEDVPSPGRLAGGASVASTAGVRRSRFH